MRTRAPAILLLGILLTIITWLVEHFARIGRYGFEFPLIAFLLGLVFGEALRVDKSIFRRLNPWIAVDASLILLGFTAGFDRLAALNGKAGIIASVNIAASIAIGMYFAYKLGIDERFSATFVAGGSVCGISASIATGRAANAEFAHLVIAMLLIALVGAPFAIGVALAANALGNIGAALVGGVIDSTPVVRAVAEGLKPSARNIALSIKYAQNVLIPLVAIVLAYVAARLGGAEARIPLAIILMLFASIAATMIHMPRAIVDSIMAARNWLLAFAMVMAGMATPLNALKKPGVMAAIVVFAAIEIINIIVAYGLATLLLS